MLGEINFYGMNEASFGCALQSVPSAIDISSPYLVWPPEDTNQVCLERIGCIQLIGESVFKNQAVIRKVALTSIDALKTSHYVLNPILDYEDPTGDRAKETGVYSVKVVAWKVIRGKLSLSKKENEEWRQTLTQWFTAKDLRLSFDE